ncbi:hypothetical protein ACFORL_01340 [Legionella dresdenensis]|uniref:Uncharacterized protein n=1 Tax=Legionella dresdenensis TaxID=450200 RepID=A0ABV8CC21_9GAMM
MSNGQFIVNGLWSKEVILEHLRSLKTPANSLNLTGDVFSHPQVSFKELVENIPHRITALILDGYDLNPDETRNLITGLPSLHKRIKSLIINNCKFNPPEAIVQVFGAVPEWVTDVDLAHNQLGEEPDFINAIPSLHPDIRKLSLANNQLEKLTPSQFSDLLAGLKQPVLEILDLAGNNFDIGAGFYTAFTSLKTTVNSLIIDKGSKVMIYCLTPRLQLTDSEQYLFKRGSSKDWVDGLTACVRDAVNKSYPNVPDLKAVFRVMPDQNAVLCDCLVASRTSEGHLLVMLLKCNYFSDVLATEAWRFYNAIPLPFGEYKNRFMSLYDAVLWELKIRSETYLGYVSIKLDEPEQLHDNQRERIHQATLTRVAVHLKNFKSEMAMAFNYIYLKGGYDCIFSYKTSTFPLQQSTQDLRSAIAGAKSIRDIVGAILNYHASNHDLNEREQYIIKELLRKAYFITHGFGEREINRIKSELAEHWQIKVKQLPVVEDAILPVCMIQ